MNRYTYQVTKDVEVLAENEKEALAAVVLEDYDNEAVNHIQFLYKSSEDFFDGEPSLGTAVDQTEEDEPNDEPCGAPDCNCAAPENTFDEVSYDGGFGDGYEIGLADGEEIERARIHDALVDF